MSFLLFVMSWFLPYAIYRIDEQRAEKIHNAHLKLGRSDKNPDARKRRTEARLWAAMKSAILMAVMELPFLFFLDHVVYALGVAVGAFMIALASMPSFEMSTHQNLERRATDKALHVGEKPTTGEFAKSNGEYLEPVPQKPLGNHGSATVESAEQSGMIDRDAAAPMQKGGR